MKKAFITGITGQDGSYLAELLISKGYEVHGLARVKSDFPNLKSVQDKLHFYQGTLADHGLLETIIATVKPDEFYHFAGSSFYKYSFAEEAEVLNNNFQATHTLLGAIKEHSPETKFFFAGSAEMFGDATESPQSEQTRFDARTIYAIAKQASFDLIRFYRENYGIQGCTALFYNHESPRRGNEFVTRKITSTVAKIKRGFESKLILGNLDTARDWGYAPDFVEAAWLMLQKEKAEDFVISTGITHTVREFVERAFQCVDLDYKKYVETDPKFFRPTETVARVGNNTKAKSILGWAPKKSFDAMISEMVASDLKGLPDVH